MLPIKLKIENFFSHKNSEIDFSLFNSALLLGNIDGDYAKSNGSGKCLHGSTVLTNAISGERLCIEDLYKRNITDFYVWGMNKDYKLIPAKVIASQLSGKKELLKITMENGVCEIVSKTHPIYCDSLSTKEAHLFSVGEFVAQPRILGALKDVENPILDIIPYNIYAKKFLELKENGISAITDEFGLCFGQNISSNMSRADFEKYSKHISDDNFVKLSQSDIFWSKIVKIEDFGIDDTYDIEVDNDTHLYALDGFITHNSAIMESLLWCLYNKSRATTMDDVITWGESKCCVSLEFSHLNNVYIVKRTRMKQTSTSTVELMILDSDNKWKSMSASTSGETNDKIVKLLKIDYKTFVNSAYFRQNDISEFAISEASKRKEILKSIIDISKWDLYEKDAKKKAKEIQTETIKLQAKYESLKAEVDSLSQSESQFLSASLKLKEKTELKLALQGKRDALSERYLKIKNNIDTESWDRTSAEIASQKILGRDLKSRYDHVMSPLQKRLDRKESILSKISSLDKKIKTLSFDPDVDSKIEKVSAEIIEYSGSVQQSKIKLKELSEIHLVEGECFTCKQSIDSETFNRLKEEKDKNLEHYSMKKANSEKRIAYLSSAKKELDAQKAINLEIEKAMSDKASLEAELLPLEDEILSSEKEKKEIHERMIAVKQKILDGEQTLLSLKDETFQSLHQQLKEIELELEENQSQILSCGILVGSLTEKTKSLSSKKIELEELKKDFDIKSEQMSLFEKLSKMFGKSGIQTLLLDAIISDLESSSNRILSSICSEQLVISLPTQRVGSDGVSIVETLDLNVKKDGSICGFSSLSGGEQFRIALSLRIALSELATKHGGSSLEFLLLDEINSPLDKSGVETLFVNIIKQLESKYKILVITHDDSLKERFDNVIDVSKTNGDSFISFTTANITT